MALHQRLNIDYWKQFFSLTYLRGKVGGIPGTGTVSGPLDIAILEQLRDASYAHQPDIERVSTDVVIWSRGEPDHRALTKIGGLPYRAADTPWPLAPSGTPMPFVAQICFADSRDLALELPGDILLIFSETEDWGSETNYHFKFTDRGTWSSDPYLLDYELGGRRIPLCTL